MCMWDSSVIVTDKHAALTSTDKTHMKKTSKHLQAAVFCPDLQAAVCVCVCAKSRIFFSFGVFATLLALYWWHESCCQKGKAPITRELHWAVMKTVTGEEMACIPLWQQVSKVMVRRATETCTLTHRALAVHTWFFFYEQWSAHMWLADITILFYFLF